MRVVQRVALLLLSLFILTTSAVAGPLEDALAAINAKQYEKAAALLAPLADKGDVNAEYNLGLLYLDGQGVKRNLAMALALLTRAANGNDPRAQFRLGLIFHDGQGVAADPARAAQLFRNAAEQGHTQAKYALATILANGEGVPRDFWQAGIWFRRAADDGFHAAYFTVGYMNEIGAVASPNAVEAARWYYDAVRWNDVRALMGIGRLAAAGQLVGDNPNKEIAFAAFSLAGKLLKGQDATAAANLLAKVKSTMTAAELAAGKKRYTDALGDGDQAALLKDPCMFVDMLIGDPGRVKANCLRWAALGMPVAEYNLGWMSDGKTAVGWLKLAASSDFPAAELELGKRLASGSGVSKDLVQALGWFMVAERRLKLPELTSNYREDAIRQLLATTLLVPEEDYKRAAAWAGQWNASHPVRPQPEALTVYEDAMLLVMQKNDSRGAIEMLTKALAIDPLFTNAFNRRSEIKVLLGEFKAAREDTNAALHIEPQNPDALFDLGQIDVAQGHYAEAVAGLSALIEKYPDPWRPYVMRARAYRAIGAYDLAATDDSRAIELEAPVPDLRMTRGLDYFLAGRFDDSAADYHSYASNAPGQPRYAAIMEYVSLGHAGKDGRATLRQVIASVTDNSWPLAVAHYFIGSLPEAGLMASAKSVQEKCEARYYIGEQKLIANDAAGALTQFTSVASVCPRELEEQIRAAWEVARLKK